MFSAVIGIPYEVSLECGNKKLVLGEHVGQVADLEVFATDVTFQVGHGSAFLVVRLPYDLGTELVVLNLRDRLPPKSRRILDCVEFRRPGTIENRV